MLMEAEGVSRKNKKIGWKVVLVAAVVAGLAVTAAASPAIYNALFGAKVEKDPYVWQSATDPADGSSYEMNVYEVDLQVEFGENAPVEIEEFYVPAAPAGFEQIKGHLYEKEDVVFLAEYWWTQDGAEGDIFFSQVAGGSADEEFLKVDISAPLGNPPRTGLYTVGELQGYLVDVPPVGDGIRGDRIFCWSDGQYLFRLEMPYGYSDTQLEELVKSVTAVEDIAPYLVSMDQQE